MNNNLDLKSPNFGNVSFFNTVFYLISRDTLNSINTKGNFTFSTHLLLLGNRMKQCVSCLICCIMQISQNLKSEKIQWYHAQQWSSSLLVLTEKSYFLYRQVRMQTALTSTSVNTHQLEWLLLTNDFHFFQLL